MLDGFVNKEGKTFEEWNTLTARADRIENEIKERSKIKHCYGVSGTKMGVMVRFYNYGKLTAVMYPKSWSSSYK